MPLDRCQSADLVRYWLCEQAARKVIGPRTLAHLPELEAFEVIACAVQRGIVHALKGRR